MKWTYIPSQVSSLENITLHPLSMEVSLQIQVQIPTVYFIRIEVWNCIMFAYVYMTSFLFQQQHTFILEYEEFLKFV